MRIWQAATVIALTTALLNAGEKVKEFTWKAPKVMRSMFTQDLGMLGSERDEYATNLAAIAGNQVAVSRASADALVTARQMIGLALQLSPRNKKALVLNFQFSKGMIPEVVITNYSPQVFARLLLTRGQLLKKQGGNQDAVLARYFLQLAATLDPRNDDAVYASEVSRLDQGALDWSVVTDAADASAAATKGEE